MWQEKDEFYGQATEQPERKKNLEVSSSGWKKAEEESIALGGEM